MRLRITDKKSEFIYSRSMKMLTVHPRISSLVACYYYLLVLSIIIIYYYYLLLLSIIIIYYYYLLLLSIIIIYYYYLLLLSIIIIYFLDFCSRAYSSGGFFKGRLIQWGDLCKGRL